MKEVNKIDLGSIKVHKKVLADIASSAIKDIDGIKLVQQDLTSCLPNLWGARCLPGVVVNVDKNNQVSMEVKVVVRYGLNIQDIARQAQDVIRQAVERTVDIDLKDVNINIQGIERGGEA